jgi:hypothetical protein
MIPSPFSMKQQLNIIVLSCLAFALTVACSSDSKALQKNIRWYSLKEGIKIAGERERKVFLYFRADW